MLLLAYDAPRMQHGLPFFRASCIAWGHEPPALLNDMHDLAARAEREGSSIVLVTLSVDLLITAPPGDFLQAAATLRPGEVFSSAVTPRSNALNLFVVLGRGADVATRLLGGAVVPENNRRLEGLGNNASCAQAVGSFWHLVSTPLPGVSYRHRPLCILLHGHRKSAFQYAANAWDPTHTSSALDAAPFVAERCAAIVAILSLCVGVVVAVLLVLRKT